MTTKVELIRGALYKQARYYHMPLLYFIYVCTYVG